MPDPSLSTTNDCTAQAVSQCRMCGSTHLTPILSLGRMAMTGIFPKNVREFVPFEPLELLKCEESVAAQGCGLLQLAHNFDVNVMYGANYGYRSGLNGSMVRHLHELVAEIGRRIPLARNDLILDIGSNDGTLLSAYPSETVRLGMDPTGIKFAKYYPSDVHLIPDFFSAQRFRQEYGQRKARVITAIAMFYDLPAPLTFMREIRECLADDGLWVIEMSHMPTMLERLAYDTICHEHLEYYGLRQIHWLAQRSGFRILHASLNEANGGSLRVFMTPEESPVAGEDGTLHALLEREQQAGLDGLHPYRLFADRVRDHRERLRATLDAQRQADRLILGYGASTKGNVLLQYCGLTSRELPMIADVNEDKHGCVTPGTHIPIVAEADAKALHPDGFLILPWHFRPFILQREAAFLRQGGRFILPLPAIEEVCASSPE
ncbi:MAG: class I SAM-dependent methyltransferase [Magnetococcales bacterium]|nr:class I SAM-dependent methyltransferase [Magnetococcales bacterium]